MSVFYGEGSTRELKQDWGLLLLPRLVLSSSREVTVIFFYDAQLLSLFKILSLLNNFCPLVL